MKKLIALCLLLTATVVHGQMKFAHVNSQRLLDSLPSYKKAENDLKKFQDDGMAELSVLEKQINDAYVKLDGIKNDLTPTMLKIEQEKIMGLEQRYQQTQNLLQQQLQTLANEYNQPILDRLQKAVEIVADRKKVNYVLDTSKLLYSKGGIDITAEVKAELLRLDAEAMKK
ncbi:MAG: OmpH family outer membrane protein [Flavobacteriia bacterium]|nr:OmpH family outer membrane protein [Flavobacteriia bacterium]